MFKAFSERIDPATRKRMALSVVASALAYGALFTTVVVAASTQGDEVIEEDKGPRADVTFVKELPAPPKKAEPAPAPAPAPPAPKPPPEVAKVTPPPVKPRPKAPDKMTDKQVPTKPAEPAPAAETSEPPPSQNYGTGEADATGTGAGGTGSGDGTGTGTGTGDGDAGGGGGGGAVILPPGATPAAPIGVLITADDYPRGMRSAGIEGTVIVKVIIQVDGSVDIVKFIKSDPNFDDAVKTILKRVRYRPAVYNGQPIAVYQNIRFPFTIDDE